MAFSSSSYTCLQIPPTLITSRKNPPLPHPPPLLHRTNSSSKLLQSRLFSRRFLHPPRTLKCFSKREAAEEPYEFERLFSNLNQASLKREPGSLSSAIFLVAGTTVGAGILAIPAVTQDSGFLASAVTCILCWVYMVVTGLLIAEVNVNTMCELGSGGVSLDESIQRSFHATKSFRQNQQNLNII